VNRVLIALLRTVWLYSLAVFAYVALTAVFKPARLSHHVWPGVPVRTDDFGIVCVAVSAVAYVLLGLLDRRPAGKSAR
jgi:hypothetical protein